MSFIQSQIKKLIKNLNINTNGQEPRDIKINNPRFFSSLFFKGSLGLGEAYIDKYWDCEKLDEFFYYILSQNADNKIKKLAVWQLLSPTMVRFFVFSYLQHILPRFSKLWAFKIGSHHYDAGNDLFKTMLDKRMVYTCGYWKNALSLDEAQEAKLDLVCKKIGLKKGDKILDIGCGWGSFAKFAAERYGAQVVGVTVSREQVELARERCAGLSVEIRLQDYRDVEEKFDHIVSLGMFEHVQPSSYSTYMEIIKKNLRPNGLFLLHTIGTCFTGWYTEPWMAKYIFPNSKLPSPKQVTESIEGLFVLRDWHEFGADYDKTLMAWYKNFVDGWPDLQNNYNERFYRMWSYYLLSCAASFRAGKNQLWQIVLSRSGENIDYRSIR